MGRLLEIAIAALIETKPQSIGQSGLELGTLDRVPVSDLYTVSTERAAQPESTLNATCEGTVLPSMPAGVKLIEWNLKDPPVAIETCAIVVDSALFAQRTLEQLRVALENPKLWVGWTVSQLIDRLAQVGAIVVLEKVGGVP